MLYEHGPFAWACLSCGYYRQFLATAKAGIAALCRARPFIAASKRKKRPEQPILGCRMRLSGNKLEFLYQEK